MGGFIGVILVQVGGFIVDFWGYPGSCEWISSTFFGGFLGISWFRRVQVGKKMFARHISGSLRGLHAEKHYDGEYL